ncbi:high-affinity choline transporter 1 isoform X2 [Planococcus citri]|uniref:high-affinity choline transporter 1 isoform X2 n=1 Tax=Planococcus citri TaxID=170843 RepID=UPI0031F88792
MLNIAGIVSIVLFYLLILVVGIWAGRKKEEGNDSEEEVMLAGRNIGLFVGIFTMTGGIFFANPMRVQGYVTMLDPLQDSFGERMGGLLFLPALCGEVFWAAGILAALGATLSVIIDMDQNTSVILSACVAVFYTLFGGLYSVAYTDVIQLFCIFIGLWLCVPFAWANEKVKPLLDQDVDWIGQVPKDDLWSYIDYGLLLIFGGIPWQVYFQRVLSSKSAVQAQLLSYVAAFGCMIMAIPPVLIGAIAKATPWNETDYKGPYPLTPVETSMVLPMVLQYLTPDWVSFFGLGAVSAAVMSSADSSVLSASSMFARNIYKLMLRQQASEMEIIWVMRVAIFVVGVLSTLMALTIPSIYGLWSMCSDLVYVILFPQLLMVVHFKKYCNTYGSLSAYIIALSVRISGGEAMLGLPAFIHFPGWDGEKQHFPFRTTAMLLSLFTLVFVSWLSKWLFETGRLSAQHDYFHCVVNIPEDVVKVGDEDDEHHQQRTALKASSSSSSSMAATVPTYGGTSNSSASASATLVGDDERNGRVNPALEVNDDEIDLTEMKRRKAKRIATAAAATANTQQNVRPPSNTFATQGQTSL